MRTLLGIILLVAGAALMLYGIGTALGQFVGLYQGAVDDAMGMKANAEQDASRAMIRAVIIGACGVPLFIVGSVLLKVTVAQRLMGRKQARGPRRQT